MSLINQINIKKAYREKSKNKGLRIIIPELTPNWMLGFSVKELYQFSELIYTLNNSQGFELSIKKKKEFSRIEDYLSKNYPSNSINFIPPIRGLMDQFSCADIILSLGISSIAVKSSELFDLPYIIFDKTNNSFDEWQSIYSKAETKVEFAKNIEEILNILDKHR